MLNVTQTRQPVSADRRGELLYGARYTVKRYRDRKVFAAALSEVAGQEISWSMVQNYETNRTKIPVNTVYAWAAVTGHHPDYFIYGPGSLPPSGGDPAAVMPGYDDPGADIPWDIANLPIAA